MQCLFVSAAHKLDNEKQAVNDLNVFPVPDGDTGTNMSMTVLAAEKALSAQSFETAGQVVSAVASATLRGARGNSGVILSQILRGFATALANMETVTAEAFVAAFSSAAKTAYRVVMKPTEGTILTVIRCISEDLETLDEDEDVVSLFEAVCQSGNEALRKTTEMLPVLKSAGVVDAGGKGLMVILEGMLYALQNGKPMEKTAGETVSESQIKTGAREQEIRFGYCTELLVRKKVAGAQSEALKKEISGRGDSVLVIDDEDVIKVHIHTNHPGWVLERALSYGSLSDIKIDNLREQQEEQLGKASPKKAYGIVSVAAGDGISTLMQEMGADIIVSGGQTMNPSAEDLLEAIRTVRAEKILVLPNNSNIVLTAEQAADMAKEEVVVIKTKTIPQGIAALMAFDADNEKTHEDMQMAAGMVQTGLLTHAVRDTEMEGLSIHKDDFLGLCGGKIVASGAEEEAVMQTMLETMVTDETIAVTLLYGEGATEEEAARYVDSIEAAWPDAEVTVLYGGQPVYKYIVSVE